MTYLPMQIIRSLFSLQMNTLRIPNKENLRVNQSHKTTPVGSC